MGERCPNIQMDLSVLRHLLDDILNAAIHSGTNDQNGVWLPSRRPVSRLGLTLEPFPVLEAWVDRERLDAVFVHRPWQLTDAQRDHLLANEIGVLAYHLAFDERLTTGFNPVLADACGWGQPTVFGTKEGRPLGMVCALPAPLTFEAFAAQMEREFGGPLELHAPANERLGVPLGMVAVVGAMSDALVRAAAAGADAYVTGQFRQPARRAVAETGLGVIVLGHARSEIWGLRTLARQLETRCGNLQVILREHSFAND